MTCKSTNKNLNTQMKEEKICSFTQKNNRLQLIKITKTCEEAHIFTVYENKDLPVYRYQVRLNRKIIKTSISEYECRKIFAVYAQNIILQLKIY